MFEYKIKNEVDKGGGVLHFNSTMKLHLPLLLRSSLLAAILSFPIHQAIAENYVEISGTVDLTEDLTASMYKIIDDTVFQSKDGDTASMRYDITSGLGISNEPGKSLTFSYLNNLKFIDQVCAIQMNKAPLVFYKNKDIIFNGMGEGVIIDVNQYGGDIYSGDDVEFLENGNIIFSNNLNKTH